MAVIGAISSYTGKAFFRYKKDGYFTKEDVVEFVEELDDAHPNQRVSLFWDNASVHVCDETTAMLEVLKVNSVRNVPY